MTQSETATAPRTVSSTADDRDLAQDDRSRLEQDDRSRLEQVGAGLLAFEDSVVAPTCHSFKKESFEKDFGSSEPRSLSPLLPIAPFSLGKETGISDGVGITGGLDLVMSDNTEADSTEEPTNSETNFRKRFSLDKLSNERMSNHETYSMERSSTAFFRPFDDENFK